MFYPLPYIVYYYFIINTFYFYLLFLKYFSVRLSYEYYLLTRCYYVNCKIIFSVRCTMENCRWTKYSFSHRLVSSTSPFVCFSVLLSVCLKLSGIVKKLLWNCKHRVKGDVIYKKIPFLFCRFRSQIKVIVKKMRKLRKGKFKNFSS